MEEIPWDNRRFSTASRYEGDFKDEYPYYAARLTNGSNKQCPYNPTSLRRGIFYSSNEFNKIRNKAISKVEDKLQLVDNLFETIYERKEAYRMLFDAGKGLLRFLKNWRKPKYWKKLKAGSQPADLPSAWLAYNFGVMPLVGSIQSALNLLGADFPVLQVRGASGGPLTHVLDNISWDTVKLYSRADTSCMVEFRTYVKPRVNPNRALLNVMGITSPLSTIYSVLPWGWALDYFVNVSDLLANFDNRFPGVDVVKTMETNYFTGTWSELFWTKDRYGKLTDYHDISGDLIVMERKLSDLNKKLTYDFPLIGDNRAANLFSAIALSMRK